jgi:hypothetical protein
MKSFQTKVHTKHNYNYNMSTPKPNALLQTALCEKLRKNQRFELFCADPAASLERDECRCGHGEGAKPGGGAWLCLCGRS